MSDLVEFLLARIAEDEAEARDEERAELVLRYANVDWAARVLAECEAKRRIIATLTHVASQQPTDAWNPSDTALIEVLGTMAAVYADHPDYDEAWRP